jgi:hypothetical protein
MLVARPNNVIAIPNDTIDVDRKEISMPTAIVDTARASASSPYPDILGINSSVVKRDIPNTKKSISMSSFVSDASLIYAGYTASTAPNVIA